MRKSAIRGPGQKTIVSGIVDEHGVLTFDNPLNVTIIPDEAYGPGRIEMRSANLVAFGAIEQSELDRLIARLKGRHVVVRGDIDLQVGPRSFPYMIGVDSIRSGGRIACDGSEVK